MCRNAQPLKAATEGEAEAVAHRAGHKRRLYAIALFVLPKMEFAGVVAPEKTKDLVDGVDEKHHYVAKHRRARQTVVVAHYVALESVEQLAYYRTYYRRDHDILVRRTLHEGFDAELPANGGDTGRVKHRLPEIEALRACRHEVGGAGIRMQHVVEYRVVVVPFRTALEYVAEPAFEWRNRLYGSPVPRCGVLGQTFEYEQCADEGSAEYGCINPHAVPVGR